MSHKYKMKVIGKDKQLIDLVGRSSAKKSIDIIGNSITGTNNQLVIADTPFNYDNLKKVPEVSDMVYSCIDAYKRNIVGFGYSFKQKEEVGNEDEKVYKNQVSLLSKVFNTEDSTIDNFITDSERVETDRETFGTGYLEVIRKADQTIGSIKYIQAYYIRKVFSIENSIKKLYGYVQIDDSNQIVMWYNYFGNIKKMSRKGKLGIISYNEQASEIIEFPRFSTYNKYYGVPKYISAELAIEGNFHAQTSNNARFENNCVPDYFITIINGVFMDDEEDAGEFFNKNYKGSENAGKACICSVESNEDFTGATQKADIKVIDLNKWSEANHLEFEENNDNKIRRVYRVPKILTGETHDVNRSTAYESKKMAEEQVFAPERKFFNEIINQTIVKDVLRYEKEIVVEFYYQALTLVDPEETREKAKTLNETGSGTINEIRQLMGLPKYDDDMADIPVKFLNTMLSNLVNSEEVKSKFIDKVVNNLIENDSNSKQFNFLIKSSLLNRANRSDK